MKINKTDKAAGGFVGLVNLHSVFVGKALKGEPLTIAGDGL